jgi:molecular chaperone DnaJ
MKNPYETLGVSKTATADEIKRAYRKLAAKFHPDVNKSADAETKFKEIQTAWEILSDPQKKAQFDQFGSVGDAGNFGGGGGFGGFDFSGFGGDGGGLGDIFETFFGGGFSNSGRRKSPRRGRDLQTRLKISFEESFTGATKTLEIEALAKCEKCDGKGGTGDLKNCESCGGSGQKVSQVRTPFGVAQTARPCTDCGGTGKKFEKNCENCGGAGRILKAQKIEIKIPAGVSDGTVLKISNRGEAGERGAAAGDLLVQILVAESRKFERVGDDLKSTAKIHFLQAVLGGEIEIETAHGKTKIKIPAGTQPGAVLKIAGKGMPKIGRSTFGDHFLKIEIEIPKKVSRADRELYEKLAENAGFEKKKSGGLFGIF